MKNIISSGQSPFRVVEVNVHNPWAVMARGINGKPFLNTATEKVKIGIFDIYAPIKGSDDEEMMDPLKQESPNIRNEE